MYETELLQLHDVVHYFKEDFDGDEIDDYLFLSEKKAPQKETRVHQCKAPYSNLKASYYLYSGLEIRYTAVAQGLILEHTAVA